MVQVKICDQAKKTPCTEDKQLIDAHTAWQQQ